jgi:hypothetical protein
MGVKLDLLLLSAKSKSSNVLFRTAMGNDTNSLPIKQVDIHNRHTESKQFQMAFAGWQQAT